MQSIRERVQAWMAVVLAALGVTIGVEPARAQSAEATARPTECSVESSATFASPCEARDSDSVPDGLSTSDWSSIRAAYDAGRHAVVADDALPGHFRARNPGQGWAVRFDGRGFEVTPEQITSSERWVWGLDLIGYGREGEQRAVCGTASIEVDGPRVWYRWDDTLTEWYINDHRGVEHGYTLTERPEGAGMLRVELAVRGGLTPRVSGDGRDVTFTGPDGGTVLNYAGLKVFGGDGAPAPARFESSCAGLVLIVDDREALYPLTIDPIAQQAYLKASNTGKDDWFSAALAVSGDTVVVGAPLEDSNATGVNGNQADNSALNSGAAYVFVRDTDGTWSQQAYLKASNTGAADQFGYSVAVWGDTAVVGARNEDSSATGVNGNQADNSASASGAAYVFVRDASGTWSQQAYLKASNTGAQDLFGQSVAVSGDTVIVGAHQEDSSATGVNGNQADNSALDSGAAYVFVRDANGTWSQQAYVKASNTGAGDSFTESALAVSGDTVIVGAYQEDSSATGVNGNQADNSAGGSGAVYVFVRSGSGTWSQQAYLKASNTGADDIFGESVAVSEDTVVVGARSEDSNATSVNGNQANNNAQQSGAAYVFVRDGSGVWSQQAYLKASNTGTNDYFGNSVAVSGDTVAVGAVWEDSNATGVNGNQADNSARTSGAAYVFIRSGNGTWSQQAYLKASNTGEDDRFGYSVAVSGDTVAIGALYEASSATGVNGNQTDNSAANSGAAYVFTGVGPCGDPSITTQPFGLNLCRNGSGAFTVAASGTGTLAYLWRKDGTNLSDGGSVSGATTPTLTIGPALPADAGIYDCIVTSSCGSTISDAAILTYCAADFDCTGFVGTDDFTAFVVAFEAGVDAADFDGSGFVDTDDFTAFVLAFEAGC